MNKPTSRPQIENQCPSCEAPMYPKYWTKISATMECENVECRYQEEISREDKSKTIVKCRDCDGTGDVAASWNQFDCDIDICSTCKGEGVIAR